MTETVSTCLLCGATGSQPFDQRTFRGYPIINRICISCGFVFQSPRMTESELQVFYAAEYRRLYQGSEGPSAKDLAVQTQRASALLAFMKSYMRVPATAYADSLFLDIGCSAGKLMECLAQTFSCRVVGVEPGDAYRQEDQRRGLEVYATLDGIEQAGQYPCNLISLIHVLEHLPNPVQYLSHLSYKLLQPDGWLLLEVPNLYCHECFEVAHLTSFSAHTLAQVLKQAGFEIVALKKHGAPRSRLLPLYITLLARVDTRVNPDTSAGVRRVVVSPEPRVQLKRRIGMLRRRVITRLFPSLAWIPVP